MGVLIKVVRFYITPRLVSRVDLPLICRLLICRSSSDMRQILAHSVLTSLMVTCNQRSVPILDYMVRLQRYGETPPYLVSAPLKKRSDAKHELVKDLDVKNIILKRSCG